MGLYLSLVLKQTEQTPKQSLKSCERYRVFDSPEPIYL